MKKLEHTAPLAVLALVSLGLVTIQVPADAAVAGGAIERTASDDGAGHDLADDAGHHQRHHGRGHHHRGHLGGVDDDPTGHEALSGQTLNR